MPRHPPAEVLLATDLHAGNVRLSGRRDDWANQSWLAIARAMGDFGF